MMLSEAITSHNGHGASSLPKSQPGNSPVTNTIQSRLPAYGAAPVAKRLAEARLLLRGHFARLPLAKNPQSFFQPNLSPSRRLICRLARASPRVQRQ
jgi:hypothetical protein